MNKDVFVIAAYTPDDKRETLLRNLVTKLHDSKKDIILITHSITPSDIIKKCKYFIYDEENTLLTDDKYKFLVWNTCIPGYTFHSKDANRAYSTVLAVYQLFLRGFGFAKMAGYEYAHFIEYDTDFDTLDFFDNNVKKIQEGYGCLAYTNVHGHPIGCYCLLNLGFYSFEDLRLDEEKILTKFTEYAPELYFVEQLTRFFYLDNYHPFYKSDELLKKEGFHASLYVTQFNNWKVTWAVPFVQNENLHLFFMETKNKPMKVEYIVNNTYKKISISPSTFYHFFVCPYQEVNYLKIIVDDVSFLEYDLTSEETRKKLIENNILEKL